MLLMMEISWVSPRGSFEGTEAQTHVHKEGFLEARYIYLGSIVLYVEKKDGPRTWILPAESQRRKCLKDNFQDQKWSL